MNKKQTRKISKNISKKISKKAIKNKYVKNVNKKTKTKNTKNTKNTKITKNTKRFYCKIDTFDNGMKYYIKNDKTYKNVSLIFKIKCGGVTEGKYEGLSHLLEHLLFNGTKKYPNRELLSKEINKYGTILNGSTSNEYTSYYMTIHPSKLAKMIPILSEMIRFSNIDSYLIEKEKNILQNENNYRSDMNSYLGRLNKLNLLKNSIYKNNYSGDKITLKNVEKHHLHAYLNTFYQPKNCIVGILGNFNESIKDITNILKTHFDVTNLLDHYKIEKSHKKYKDYLKEEKYFKKILNTIDKKRETPIKFNWGLTLNKINHINQAYIFISFKSVCSLVQTRLIKKQHKLDKFIKNYLNHARSGKLGNVLRNQEKLIYNISVSNYNFLSHNGIFTIKYNITPEPDNIKKSIELILETLNKLKNELLTEKEIKELQYSVKMKNKIVVNNSLEELDDITSELIFANFKSPFYKEKITDIENPDTKNDKKRKKTKHQDLLTPKNIQKRAIEIFNKNKMSINCFTPNNVKLSINDLKNIL